MNKDLVGAMNLIKRIFTRFYSDDKAAVTVDWVVLTAGVVVLASVLLQYTGTAVLDISDKVAEGIDNPVKDE